jgi:hypothetical protein
MDRMEVDPFCVTAGTPFSRWSRRNAPVRLCNERLDGGLVERYRAAEHEADDWAVHGEARGEARQGRGDVGTSKRLSSSIARSAIVLATLNISPLRWNDAIAWSRSSSAWSTSPWRASTSRGRRPTR